MCLVSLVGIKTKTAEDHRAELEESLEGPVGVNLSKPGNLAFVGRHTLWGFLFVCFLALLGVVS